MRLNARIIALVFAISSWPFASPALAGLFSSINYNQYVIIEPFDLFGPDPISQDLSGTTLPVNQTLNVNSNGQSAQATYNFTDNGTVAALNINSSFTLTGMYEYAGESTGPSSDTEFEFSQPVAYIATLEDSVTGTVNGLPPFLYVRAETGQGIFSIGGPANTGDFETSGTLNAGTVYVMDDEFTVNNSYAGDSATASGTDAVSLTFTAIPEPSSFCLLAIFAFCFALSRFRGELPASRVMI